MTNFSRLWQTTIFRLSAIYVLFFIVFSIVLLGFIGYQTRATIASQNVDQINREITTLSRLYYQGGIRRLVGRINRLAAAPGPGIYLVTGPTGSPLAGNVYNLPPDILDSPGLHSIDYEDGTELEGEDDDARPRHGQAKVRMVELPSGFKLVVGRDIREQRGFSRIILKTFLLGIAGIIVMATLGGLFVSRRVLARMDAITDTSEKIMSGSLSERMPITNRNDEFDRLSRTLNEMLERIEQLMTGLKEVSDNVAHDLKTPLTRMRNRVEGALRDKPGIKNYRGALENTIDECDNLIKTFNALLLITRVEAGTPGGSFSELNATELLNDVYELYQPVAEDRDIIFEIDAEADLKIVGNKELLFQALVNLIENAIKYATSSTQDSHEIRLSAVRSDNAVIFSIADNGPGIPEADRERIFARFVRLEKSRSEPGSGLGLALVDAVARLHGGAVHMVDNKPGAKIELEIPVKKSV